MIANEFERIVSSKRGSYIEITPHKIFKNNIKIPLTEKWRMDYPMSYYIEYRTIDKENVMIYFQTRTVEYADYKIGYYYIAVKDIVNLNSGINKYL